MDPYSILAHPIRRKILLLLEKEKRLHFTSLLNLLNIDATGRLIFHIKKLGNLIKKDDKNYLLTEKGQLAIKIMKHCQSMINGEGIEKTEIRGPSIIRIGILICLCANEIADALDVASIKKYVLKLRNVVSVQIFENLCQEKNLKLIKSWYNDNFINRIVIAACSPRTHVHIFEDMFRDFLEQKVSKKIEIANIREQCAWVHAFDPATATENAKILIEAAVYRVILQEEIPLGEKIKIQKSVGIVGGGVAGITLALALARAGLEIHLIEKSPSLGGKVARWNSIHDIEECATCILSEKISEVVREKNIKIYTNTTLESISGSVGNFELVLKMHPRYIDPKKCTGCERCIEICPVEKKNDYEFGLNKRKLVFIPFAHAYPYAAVINETDIETCRACRICEKQCKNNAINLNDTAKEIRIQVGAKILAIGSELFQSLSSLKHDPENNVVTSYEFERILSSDGPTKGALIKLSDGNPPESISIIQCVNETDKCSEYCCTLAQKYIREIKKRIPECEVNLFYEIHKLPPNSITLFDPLHRATHFVEALKIETKGQKKYIIADEQQYESDMIILNVGMIPNTSLVNLRQFLDFYLDDNGFMDKRTLASGIYGCGSVTGPMDYQSTISDASKVAIKVISLLSKDYLTPEPYRLKIDTNRCGLCGLCVSECPYNAITLEGNKISIDQFQCKGCGMCVPVCSTNAIDVITNTTEKILKTIEVYSKFPRSPKVIAFCCESCGYAAADDAGLKKIQYTPNALIIKVICTGQIDSEFILHSFANGFDAVLIIGCHRNSCKFIDGKSKIEKRVELLKEIFPEIKNKIHIFSLSAIEGDMFANLVNESCKKILKVA
ncbi:MAG: hydrogenase iron-sulfur subunit [Promethearchaeota archaeon]